MIKHQVEDSIKKVYKGFIKEIHLNNVFPYVFEQVCEENKWNFYLNPEYNGWDVDWCATITLDGLSLNLYGSMYYGTVKIINNNE